ncbi:sorting nexin [Anaeramoeba flamelloides]|uniref:Sorting nexin n=1 Tax=Anaeramoeba flamelloides TaxID=1746091 RepID=A0ABQ8XEY6_9EUKA|nr:sorting nexin [Anaeramoeba flamelloides]
MSSIFQSNKVLFQVVAISPYTGKDSSELSFIIGDKISVLKNSDTMWYGYKNQESSNQAGYFDSGCVFQLDSGNTQQFEDNSNLDLNNSPWGNLSQSSSGEDLSFGENLNGVNYKIKEESHEDDDLKDTITQEKNENETYYSKNVLNNNESTKKKKPKQTSDIVNDLDEKEESNLIQKKKTKKQDPIFQKTNSNNSTKTKAKTKNKIKTKTKREKTPFQSPKSTPKKPKKIISQKSSPKQKPKKKTPPPKPIGKKPQLKTKLLEEKLQQKKNIQKMKQKRRKKPSKPKKPKKPTKSKNTDKFNKLINSNVDESVNDDDQSSGTDDILDQDNINKTKKTKQKKKKTMDNNLLEESDPKKKNVPFLYQNFTWNKPQENLMSEIKVTQISKSKNLQFEISWSYENKEFSVSRNIKDFRQLRVQLSNFEPLVIPEIGFESEKVKKAILLKSFLQKISDHPILSHTDSFKEFLEMGEKGWKKYSKSFKKKIQDQGPFIPQLQTNFKKKTLMNEYTKSIHDFKRYLNTLETHLKGIQRSWDTKIENESHSQKNLSQISEQIKELTSSGLEWRDSETVIKNNNVATLNIGSGLIGISGILNRIASTSFDESLRIRKQMNINFQSSLSDISGFKQTFQRMGRISQDVQNHQNSYLNATSTSNFKKAKTEQRILNHKKQYLDLFQLAMLAESETFKCNLLGNIQETMKTFVQSQIQFHKDSLESYQGVLEMFENDDIEKGSVYYSNEN